MSVPRPHYPIYGKRGVVQAMSQRGPPPSRSPPGAPSHTPPQSPQPSNMYPNHMQVVRFAREAWIKAKEDLSKSNDDSEEGCAYYTETEPSPQLRDFIPFNLEEFSSRRKQN